MNKILGEPLPIHTKTAPNRIVYHPTECNDADDSGNPTDLTLERYRRFAEGMPGLIFVEACGVTRESRGRTNQLSALKQNIKGLQRLVRTMREVNSDTVILFQISHDGRRCGRFSKVVSPFPTADPDIHVLSTNELIEIEDMFADAAWVVEQAGGDGIDFKNCNGYLASDILSPLNNREDQYGGSFENRTRFFKETVEKIKNKVTPSFILGARISTLTTPGGFGSSDDGRIEDLSEFLRFAKVMETSGMHYVSVHVSNADYFADKWVQMPTNKNPEDVFVHFRLTKAVRAEVTIPVMCAGYSYLKDGNNKLPGANFKKKSFLYWAEKNIMNKETDMVGVSRQSLADPHFAKKIVYGNLDDISWCTTCQNCFRLVAHQHKAGCTVYDKRYTDELKVLRQELK
jgi:2,4-dienoyl-CoA reductase-like NADH-dependent reductase (Old Yellow Enzyme family)